MKLYNSLTNKLEDFKPLNPGKVTIYVCGITPYDTTHLGHAFTYISFDVLIKFLKYEGFEVEYTQNVTDINDRDNDILKRAKEQNLPWGKLAKFWTDKFLSDMKALNWTPPTNYLWASKNLPSMLDLIKKLLHKGLAYQKNGSVYLDISKIGDFGKLSKLSNQEMLKIAKDFEEDIENPDKKNPLDITLWRATPKNQAKHIPSFDSPFGKGRPGWHLECSAMALSLGETIDIHGGGKDLIYPHHESEIAQSEGVTGKPFVKYWMHTGEVFYQGEKMSKSLGNMVMVSDLLKNYSANAIRWVLLSHHYRQDWEFHEEELKEAEKVTSRFANAHSKNTGIEGLPRDTVRVQPRTYHEDFETALENDLATPKVLEKIKSTGTAPKALLEILGFIT